MLTALALATLRLATDVHSHDARFGVYAYAHLGCCGSWLCGLVCYSLFKKVGDEDDCRDSQILVLVNDLQNHHYPIQSIKEKLEVPLYSLLLEMLVKLGKFLGLPNRFIKKHPGLKVLLTMVTLLNTAGYSGATALIIEKYGLQHICDIDRGGSSEDVKTVQAFWIASLIKFRLNGDSYV